MKWMVLLGFTLVDLRRAVLVTTAVVGLILAVLLIRFLWRQFFGEKGGPNA
jgi:hypothetical protein